jgi:hypothetical protein
MHAGLNRPGGVGPSSKQELATYDYTKDQFVTNFLKDIFKRLDDGSETRRQQRYNLLEKEIHNRFSLFE